MLPAGLRACVWVSVPEGPVHATGKDHELVHPEDLRLLGTEQCERICQTALPPSLVSLRINDRGPRLLILGRRWAHGIAVFMACVPQPPTCYEPRCRGSSEAQRLPACNI